MKLSAFLFDVLPVALWMAVIFTLSTHIGSAAHTDSSLNTVLSRYLPRLWRRLTSPEIDGLHYYVRKAAHVAEYTVLGVLMMRAFYDLNGALTHRVVIAAWAVCACYAGTDEFHQIFVPGRTAKVTDVLIDAVGALMGVGLFRHCVLNFSADAKSA